MALFIMPKASAFAQNFTPVDGALLYFYLPGSTTLITVYSDADSTTPLANPVEADADGIFPAIYVVESRFKAVLKDKNAVQIWSVDDIKNSAANFDLLGNFTSATNSSNYPSSGESGNWYRVTESFTLAAASGSHQVYIGDAILCNKDNATGIDADWDIVRGKNGVTRAGTETLTNKTLTDAVLNGGLSGTAILDSDTMVGASATTVPTSESVVAYTRPIYRQDRCSDADGYGSGGSPVRFRQPLADSGQITVVHTTGPAKSTYTLPAGRVYEIVVALSVVTADTVSATEWRIYDATAAAVVGSQGVLLPTGWTGLDGYGTEARAYIDCTAGARTFWVDVFSTAVGSGGTIATGGQQSISIKAL